MMQQHSIAQQDAQISEEAFSLCGIFQTVALSYAVNSEPLPVIQDILKDVDARLNAGEEPLDLAMEVMFHPDLYMFRNELHEEMQRLGFDARLIDRVRALEERIAEGPVDGEEDRVNKLLMLRTVDIFAEAYAKTYGDHLTSSLMPAAMKTEAHRDFCERYYLGKLKKLSLIPA